MTDSLMPRPARTPTPPAVPKQFDSMRITVASPEQIRSWSFGEIKKPETINYRTFKPERDGLFCSRIFGPTKDYECLCGKYKRMKFKNIICEKCGVEVTIAKVRRERMGHIELASPVAHIWFLKSAPSRIGTLLDIQLKQLEAVLYFEKHIVTDPGMTSLKMRQLLSEDEHIKAQDEFGEENFTAKIGAEALRDMLHEIDLPALIAELTVELANTSSELQQKKIIKRLRTAEGMHHAHIRPEWMILDVIPVIPPELRPLVPLDGGRFATSDLNDLYRRVINRNNRLRRLKELNAPDIIIRNEKRMLQEAVDALFDNGRRGRTITGTNRRPLKSLADMLKGKQGRFRQNLLGKRVDYSGRSVIVVGPGLRLHQCGLPKKMALELFKPFIFARLDARGLSASLKVSRKMVEREDHQVWDILEEVIREHPVLLNRAPTLHRLGIQAFEPVLVEGKAIQLHPLVCAAFNADFDGDQMAVHVPLSLEAQLEARVLMMSTNNILSPANGRPIIVPSQDIVLGLYYLTLEDPDAVGAGNVYFSEDEVEHALAAKSISLHAPMQVRLKVVNAEGVEGFERVSITPGRMLLWRTWPKNQNLPLSLINRLMAKAEISEAVDQVYRWCGQKETVIFCDRIMELGFTYAGRAGISIGKDDLIIPESKKALVAEAQGKVRELTRQYDDGLITKAERHNKVIDTWSTCSDRVAEKMVESMQSGRGVQTNSIYMMADSGARSSATQIKQLSGMRGLMASPSGEIIETPIISNFKEGLTVLEYFNSTHGARKGLADTALKTANSGYLTRRLVDVAQDAIVRIEDCGTKQGLSMREVRESGRVIANLSDRILGRIVLEDVKDPISGEVMAEAGSLLSERLCERIERSAVVEVQVRSPLTCDATRGICCTCYGRDLARGTLVNIGEAVGVIAAQSIGEPGTQLTMRTFHVGGAAMRGNEASSAEAALKGSIEIRNRKIIKNPKGEILVMGRSLELVLLDESGVVRSTYKIPYGARLLVDSGSPVNTGDRLAEWDPYTVPIISEEAGIARFVDLVEGVSVREVTDEMTGIASRVVVNWRQSTAGADLLPRITLRDDKGEVVLLESGSEARYFLAPDAILSVENEADIHPGDVLARVPRGATKTRDITGGLPRVVDLFEARRPKEHAVMALTGGRVEIAGSQRARRTLSIFPEDGGASEKHVIARGQHLLVRDGDTVERGELLVDGTPAAHDILRCLGVEAMADYLIGEIQGVYRLQGVSLNDKHIEVILRQMLRRYEVTNGGSSEYLVGDYILRRELRERNLALEEEGKDRIEAFPMLQGITKASLQTDSFISAASFQDTTRVLTDAAVSGKVDDLVGLKENVIVGRLIPAGSGAAMAGLLQEVAARRRIAAEAAARAKEEAEALEAAAAEAAAEAEGAKDGADSTDSAPVANPFARGDTDKDTDKGTDKAAGKDAEKDDSSKAPEPAKPAETPDATNATAELAEETPPSPPSGGESPPSGEDSLEATEAPLEEV